MKAIKSAYYSICCGVLLLTSFQGISQEYIVPAASTALELEKETPFMVKPVYFQEWYAGIDIGGTGYRVFVPVVNKKEDIKLENLYFRNLEAKLLNEDGRYTATLKNPSTTYTFTKPEKPSDYPFDLKDNECVISYNENGKTKFHKIRIVAELAGAYYENGAPSISSQRKSATLATLDEDSGN
jgi:hypothetical protein